jgi:hypothetical protein
MQVPQSKRTELALAVSTAAATAAVEPAQAEPALAVSTSAATAAVEPAQAEPAPSVSTAAATAVVEPVPMETVTAVVEPVPLEPVTAVAEPAQVVSAPTAAANEEPEPHMGEFERFNLEETVRISKESAQAESVTVVVAVEGPALEEHAPAATAAVEPEAASSSSAAATAAVVTTVAKAKGVRRTKVDPPPDGFRQGRTRTGSKMLAEIVKGEIPATPSVKNEVPVTPTVTSEPAPMEPAVEGQVPATPMEPAVEGQVPATPHGTRR